MAHDVHTHRSQHAEPSAEYARTNIINSKSMANIVQPKNRQTDKQYNQQTGINRYRIITHKKLQYTKLQKKRKKVIFW